MVAHLESERIDAAAVVLAAGAGRRFVGDDRPHKLLADFRGRPLVVWSLEAVLGARLGATFVVTGAVELDALLPPGVLEVHNDSWNDGLASSLRCGIAAASAAGFVAAVVGLADQPLVRTSDWGSVAECRAPIAVATYHGVRRNPVRLDRSVWDELPEVGDDGARVLMRRRPELVVEVACDGDPVDIDTFDDLRRALGG